MRRRIVFSHTNLEEIVAVETSRLRLIVHRADAWHEGFLEFAEKCRKQDPNVLFLIARPEDKIEVYDEVEPTTAKEIFRLLRKLGATKWEFSAVEAIEFVIAKLPKKVEANALDVLTTLYWFCDRTERNKHPAFLIAKSSGMELFVPVAAREVYWYEEKSCWALTQALVERISAGIPLPGKDLKI